MHRFTLLGWAWPVVRQLAQLAVLVFVFSTILDLGIDNFPVFVFSGLIAWSWFAGGVQQATASLIANRHLVFQSRFPVAVLPIVAVAVPFIDVLLVAAGARDHADRERDAVVDGRPAAAAARRAVRADGGHRVAGRRGERLPARRRERRSACA